VKSSVFDTYLAHRRDGASPTAAGQLTARDYGHRDAQEIDALTATLRRLEERDRPILAPPCPAGSSHSNQEVAV
jgi:hypothetical protein